MQVYARNLNLGGKPCFYPSMIVKQFESHFLLFIFLEMESNRES